jgi:hypothetical protein
VIYLRNNIMVKSYAMKKVGEIEYREMLTKGGAMLSRVIHGLDIKQVALVGLPFTESYDVDARIKVSVDGFHVFTLVNPNDRVWTLDSQILFHAYDDEKPLGAFATNEMKVTIEWIPRKDIGREVPCGIKMGIYEMDEALKEISQ